MKFKEVIGIDVGKLTNEAVIHSNQLSQEFSNTPSGFKLMLKWTLKNVSCSKEEILFAFEHTGLYSFPISVFLTENGLSFVILPGLEIKRSMGIQRGKNDKIDAKRIALYTYRRKDEIKPYLLPSKKLIEIRRLLSLRERLVVQRASYIKNVKENIKFLKRKDNRVFFEVQEKMLKELTTQINKIENQLDSIVNEDSAIKKMFDLITSIKGVGKQTALFMIAFTNGFTLFANWRKFASYAGTAPFPYKSGISINGKSKLNHLANKKFKVLLNLCATNAIIHNPEMKAYFERRKAEGKNGMSTINIVRNKILARIFAVINRGTPYVNTCKYAA
jgi:transposase